MASKRRRQEEIQSILSRPVSSACCLKRAGPLTKTPIPNYWRQLHVPATDGLLWGSPQGGIKVKFSTIPTPGVEKFPLPSHFHPRQSIRSALKNRCLNIPDIQTTLYGYGGATQDFLAKLLEIQEIWQRGRWWSAKMLHRHTY